MFNEYNHQLTEKQKMNCLSVTSKKERLFKTKTKQLKKHNEVMALFTIFTGIDAGLKETMTKSIGSACDFKCVGEY